MVDYSFNEIEIIMFFEDSKYFKTEILRGHSATNQQSFIVSFAEFEGQDQL